MPASHPPQARPVASTRQSYAVFRTIETRWSDNDVYAHMNNVAYYSLFDTMVNGWLIESGLLDIRSGAGIGVVVENGCRYFAEIAFPDRVAVGLRVAHVGRSSVRYEVGLFRNEETSAAAEGFFIHVYVDRVTRRPRPMTDAMRTKLQEIAP